MVKINYVVFKTIFIGTAHSICWEQYYVVKEDRSGRKKSLMGIQTNPWLDKLEQSQCCDTINSLPQ